MSRTRSRRDRRTDQHTDRRTAAAVCPQCGAEFVVGVETCSDCHVGLVAPMEPAERLASPDGLVAIGSWVDPSFARTLAEAFNRVGIAHHFEMAQAERMGEFGPVSVPRLGAYVRPEDSELAYRLYQAINEAPSRDTEDAIAVAETLNLAPDPSEAPRRRDFELAEVEPRDESHFSDGLPTVLHLASLALLVGAAITFMFALTGSISIRGLVIGSGLAISALALYRWGKQISKQRLSEWEQEETARRAELAATDWDAIETKERRALEAIEQEWRDLPEPDPDDRQSGET